MNKNTNKFSFAIRFGKWANKHCVGCSLFPIKCEGLSFYKILDKTEKDFGFDYSGGFFPNVCKIKAITMEREVKK